MSEEQADYKTEMEEAMDAQEMEMWAWYSNVTKTFSHIYGNRELVEMCIPDGYKKKTKLGEGRVTRISIKAIEPDSTDL